jgi:hypothetical protein
MIARKFVKNLKYQSAAVSTSIGNEHDKSHHKEIGSQHFENSQTRCQNSDPSSICQGG